MKRVFSMALCLAVVTAFEASAQERETQRRDQDQSRNQAQRGQQQGQQQTIRGIVAGVTTVGEAVIDPQTGRAVAVQQNYLTVLGSPAGGGQRGQRGQDSATTPGQRNQPGQDAERTPGQRNRNQEGQARNRQAGQGRQAMQGRQNLYLIAITRETTVREGGQQPGQRSDQQPGPDAAAGGQDRTQNQSAFEKLEIGDRVMVQFKTTDRLHAKAEGGEAEAPKTAQDDAARPDQEQTTGFRGDPKSKHGRNRIFVGEASTITVMSADAGQQRGGQRGQQRDRQDDSDN